MDINMNKKNLLYNIYADLYRTCGRANKKLFFFMFLTHKGAPGFKYIVKFRICNYFYSNRNILIYKLLYKLMNLHMRKLQYKYGIEIPIGCNIGEGLTIPHNGGIVINGNAVIGKNCTILQGVTIGANTFKDRYRVAKIGDNVMIGAGAKLIGPICIGDDVTIGANSIVTKDIPDGVVVAGIPAKIISHKKSVVIYGEY